MMPLSFLALVQPLIDTVQGVVIAQAVIGIIALIGGFAILRRFLGTEFPAFRAEVKEQFAGLSVKVENLSEKVQTIQSTDQARKVMEHEFERRLARLEGILEQRMQNSSATVHKHDLG